MAKRRRKDRKDGYYLYDTDPMHKLMPFLMPKRTECEVFMRESIDVTDILRYIDQRKKIDGNRVTFFSLLMATIVRTFAMRPALNNFVAGHRIYRRKNIDIGFVIKKEFSDTGDSTIVRMAFHPSSTVTEVSDRLYDRVDEFRASEAIGGGADKMIRTLVKLPRLLTRFSIKFLRFLNYYGWVPKDLVDSDPNFASVFVSNMGSLKSDAPFHHLNNWGTNSMFATIGTVEDRVCVHNGQIAIRKFVDFALTVDERIADGYYFARSIDIMKNILSDPASLEAPFVTEEAE